MPSEPARDRQITDNAAAAFRRFEDVMKKLVKVSKKDLDEKIAARRAKRAARKPA